LNDDSFTSAPQLKRDPLDRPVPLSLLNTVLHIVLALFAATGILVALYEGASWAHRRPGVAWWWTFRPDRLFRSEFYTPEGDRLRRRAARFLFITAILGAVLLLGLVYRATL